jgi:hypothetical protein
MTRTGALAREAGQRLWTQVSNDARTPEERATLAEEAFARLERALVRWIGADGYRVLLERALENAKATSPSLANVRVDRGTVIGIAASVRENDVLVAGDIMVTLLAQLLGLLSRVVGEEVALRLVEQAWHPGPRAPNMDNGNSGRPRDD